MQEWQIKGRRGDGQQNLIYIKSSQLQANKNQEIGLSVTDVVVGRHSNNYKKIVKRYKHCVKPCLQNTGIQF